MNKTGCSQDENRIKFIIAVMTKDYVNAEVLGKSILAKEPTNIVIRQYMTLIQGENFAKKTRESDSDQIEESTSESGESDSELGNDVNDDINLDDCHCKIDFSSQKFSKISSPHLKKKLSTLLNYKGISANFEKNVYRTQAEDFTQYASTRIESD
ncbi:uncharacterized protein LOC117172416 [Belonocnema kinseyi]|uniref:uncharacterized protein LOC117172416 n=1 Tax=Belonocnema kinseyi TaxID=2817044 RepID=UPI00143D5CDD|nr:uncharacterized protein LOC117172416 [Belonocnema kinseyi]